ncbi:MAG: serine hydrolase [Alphaproteobacteria bacterium]|jgi:CubicO group peptidase (beta-lactamase class C family)|nr:serine hydrolase [Rhodospirillaceae bacterium]MBT6205467.1 serine hydrolase [Rhodospirillaceae bacterium]MBT6509041.1 serine hydrolase [Rhodospirillaceae bacterium]MBT7649074.1 serine hydrolase [Rhodospirillaceae bacterium]MDG2479860.1 serine hydrolase [Alphaproteobacteria bacterium]
MAKNKTHQPAAPDELGDGWQTSAPGELGLDPMALAGIVPHFSQWHAANVHAVLIARHGSLAFERYFEGEDEAWGRPLGRVAYDAGKLHDLRSVTKSVVSLLFGIAARNAGFDELDTPVLSFFPEHSDLTIGNKKHITVRHLLEMSTGLAWNEEVPYSDPANSEILMTNADDRCRYVLDQELVRPPGRAWQYSGGTTTLLAEIIHRLAGKQVDALARESLFDALGMHETDWLAYDDGVPIAASGLRLRPRDLLKIGQLVLDGGKRGDEQIVAQAWIEQATSPQINGQGLFFYGHHWWLGRSFVAGEEITWISGVGWGGQRLFIVPSQELVVLVMAGLYDNPILQPVPGEIVLRRYALSAAMAGER